MPPPNHQISWSVWQIAFATKKRIFMCTVGTYGLSGCNTNETPIASQARPAASGCAIVAAGGSLLPSTCEKPTPARSNTLPPSSMQLLPPPPSGRCQLSCKKVLPSTSSSASIMRFCNPCRYFKTAGGSMVCVIRINL